jgi:hypothetical protein
MQRGAASSGIIGFVNPAAMSRLAESGRFALNLIAQTAA